MVNYASGFNQSETRKYFERIIIFMTNGKLSITSYPTPNRFMFFELDLVSPARWATTLKSRVFLFQLRLSSCTRSSFTFKINR